MDSLPEELHLRILDLLDADPPSSRKHRHEPHLDLISADEHPLKNLSCISRYWRRITLPLLFKHVCLRLHRPARKAWLDCCLHSDTSLKQLQHAGARPADVDQYHLDLLAASPSTSTSTDGNLELRKTRSAGTAHEYARNSKAFASRMYHALKDFLSFVTANQLPRRIASFVLLSRSMLSDRTETTRVGRLPSPSLYDWRYEASATMWRHLLSVINPQRITILAPPMELACFCNSYIGLDADLDLELAWAFTDMDYHSLELRQQAEPWSSSRLTQPPSLSNLRPIPASMDIAPSSLFHLRPWNSVSLNEGSFLQAYGTYEYFERGPPSLISSISPNFGSVRLPGHASTARALSNVRSFTYTAIFPFANHLDFLEMLTQLETLDLQFAPDPQSGILDDRERTGRAELQDCWQELISAYHDIATAISTFRMSREEFPNLKTFICRDMSIPALKDDLGHIFTPLCLPVWAEYTDGVFSRIADKAELPGVDDII